MSATTRPIAFATHDTFDAIRTLLIDGHDGRKIPDARSQLRKLQPGHRASSDVGLAAREIHMGDAMFDMERLELTRDGKPQRLTEAEAQLLKTLAIHAHAPVERMTLSPIPPTSPAAPSMFR